MNTGTLSRPSSPALAQRSSTLSSMASPTKTTARTRGGDRLAPRFRQHLADLGVAAPAIDLAHQLCQLRAVGNPAGGTALVEAAIINQADIETAQRRRLAKHVGLQRAGHVPCRLPAHGGVEREYQPAPGASRVRRHRAGLGDKGGDVFRGGRPRRPATNRLCRPLRRRGLFRQRFRFGRFAGHKRSPMTASLMWAGIRQAGQCKRLAQPEVADGRCDVAVTPSSVSSGRPARRARPVRHRS